MAKRKSSDSFTESGDQAPGSTESSTETISKIDAVRDALAHGIKKPREGIAFIKEKHGLDVPAQIFSSYKSTIQKKKGIPGRRGRPRGRPAGAGHAVANGKASNPVQLARHVKQLVEQFGVGAVREMVEVFE